MNPTITESGALFHAHQNSCSRGSMSHRASAALTSDIRQSGSDPRIVRLRHTLPRAVAHEIARRMEAREFRRALRHQHRQYRNQRSACRAEALRRRTSRLLTWLLAPRVICAWCKCIVRIGSPRAWFRPASHGICEHCARTWRAI